MTDVHIDGIRVRVGGLTSAQGRQLGARIASLLTDELAGGSGAPRDVGQMQVRVSAKASDTVDHLAAQVVTAIIRAM